LFREGTLRPDEVDVVQVAQPTRPGVPAYRDLRLETERRAHDLSVRWIRRDGRPAVTTHFEARERANVLALLATADVALVTPRRDGMNLVAKEFSLVNERDGVLVLGRGAGAADALGSAAVLVDGARPRSVADGVRRAIDLPPTERRTMAASRRAAVLAWTAADWSTAYLDGLERHDEATSDAAACAL
jgi:trehalose-6-phosphate synthase